MAQTSRICQLVLLGMFLIVFHAYGEERRSRQVAVGESGPEARKALAESIPRREVELALRQRMDVLKEVKQRIEDLSLNASADELTDLLEQRAYLEISVDKCKLGMVKSGCRAVAKDLAIVEASFRDKAGISTREFRSGRRDTLAGNVGLAGKPEARSTTKAAGDKCTCTFSVSSRDRWMNRWWGLECKGHASHGVCSDDVDSGHTPGSGAMTGDVNLYFDRNNIRRECPDDQYTCFRGPRVEHAGEWGNTCSCDTWHSQYYNPYGSWYGGDLADSLAVHQLSTGWLTSVGASCNETYVAVKEFIQENDPWCCDDPLGDLLISLPLTEGSGSTSGQVSAQNCNGGSQSGYYPYCGTFGATIQVDYNCYTTPAPTCDPNDEQSCFEMGYSWVWDPSSCSCSVRCEPEAFCAEYDYANCMCLRGPY